MSLLEVTIASLILVLLGGMSFLILRSSTVTTAWGTIHADLNGRARDLLDRMTREVADSSVMTFVPSFPKDAPSLTFRRVTGYAAGKPTFGPPIAYMFVPDSGEIDNGIDDNRDGRVDEGAVARSEGGGRPVVICRDVRKGGLAITQAFGNTLTIRLVLERRDADGRPVTYVRQTTVQVRN
jgi:hypothetical protein